MWNLVRKKKKTDKNIESSKHIRTRKALKNNAGFTLVELIVAVTVFALMVPTLTSAFIVSARINSKGRQQEQAMTIAQNLMEGIKYFGLASLSEQVNTNTFTIVSNGTGYGVKTLIGQDKSDGGSYRDGAFTRSTSFKTVDVVYNDDGDTQPVKLYEYEYWIENILMGSTYYDAKIIITQSENETYLVAQTEYYQTYFTDVAMKSMKYYDVEIDVYLSDDISNSLADENGYRAQYTGSFTDKD